MFGKRRLHAMSKSQVPINVRNGGTSGRSFISANDDGFTLGDIVLKGKVKYAR